MAMLDTLKATRQLQEAGFPEPQADALVATFADGFGENLATKHDIALLRAEIEAVRGEMREMEQRLIIRMYVIMGGGVAFLSGVIGIATAIIVATT